MNRYGSFCARSSFVLLIAVSLTQADVPRMMQYQGKLLNASGAALAGPVVMRIRLYDNPTNMTPVLFDETHAAVQLNRGLFSVLLGSLAPGGLPDSALAAPAVYLGVAIDGAPELMPRRRVATAPYTVRARSAEQLVRPGSAASEVAVDTMGRVSVGSAGADASAKLDVSSTSLGFLPPRMTTAQRSAITNAANGLQVFNTDTNCLEFFVGSSWQPIACGCVSAPATPGPITGPTTACAGQTGNVYEIAAVFGALSYTWSVPPGSSITAGQGTTTITVTSGNAGGSITVAATNSCGSSADRTLSITVPMRSCLEIKQGNPSATTGTYTIDVDCAGSEPSMSVYCDMAGDEGGWTLVARMVANNLHYTPSAVGTLTSPAQSTTAKLSDAQIRLLGTELYRFTCETATDYFDATQFPFNTTDVNTLITRHKDTYLSPTWRFGEQNLDTRGLRSHSQSDAIIWDIPAQNPTGCFLNGWGHPGYVYAR